MAQERATSLDTAVDRHDLTLERPTIVTVRASHLARRELRVAPEEWLGRFSDTRIPARKKAEWHTEAVFGVGRLPLQFDRIATP